MIVQESISIRACTRSVLRCVMIALACSLPMRAWAEPSAAERETARSLMDDADRLRESGDKWGALERLQAADQIMHAPTTALELARVQASLAQLVEARASALAAATFPEVAGEPRAFTAARKAAIRLASELAPRVPDVTVVVSPAAADLTVRIDGITWPRSARPLPFKLNPGPHMLEVAASGYAMHTAQFTLAEKQHLELKVELAPEAYMAGAVIVVPKAAPAEPQPPAAQRAQLDLQVSSDDADAAGRTRGYVGVIAGGVAFAVGAVTGLISAGKTSAIHDACGGYSCPVALQSDLVTAYTLANVANVTIPVGLLGIGYGIYELITHRATDQERTASARLKLDVTLDRPGLSLRGAL